MQQICGEDTFNGWGIQYSIYQANTVYKTPSVAFLSMSIKKKKSIYSKIPVYYFVEDSFIQLSDKMD